MRLLLIERDESAARCLGDVLRAAGSAVDWVGDGAAAQHALESGAYEAVLLDLDLADRVGLAWLKALRARGDNAPVLALSVRSDVADRIEGLDAGADDYLIKPFDAGELLARLRALARGRAGGESRATTVGPLQVDAIGRRVTREGRELALTATEFALLDALLRKPGAVVSRQRLEASIYGWGEAVASNVVEVHLHNLRRKVGGALIRTVRGVGYQLVA